MKVLLDTCVWGKAKETLGAHGHDVVWAGDWKEDPGANEILRLAYNEGRVLVTLDKDFGQLAVAFGHPHSGIVRLVGFVGQGPRAGAGSRTVWPRRERKESSVVVGARRADAVAEDSRDFLHLAARRDARHEPAQGGPKPAGPPSRDFQTML